MLSALRFINMFKKNNLFIGIIIALIAPLIAYLFTEFTTLGVRFANKPLALYGIAGAVNLLIARYFYKQRASKTGGGLIAVTFVALLLLLFLKGGIKI